MRLGIPAAVFALTFVFRWLTYGSLSGDDHWPLWTAATFLKGDLPFRDFVDLGAPLFWSVSALAQWIVGYRVIGEVILGTGLIAFAFALAFHLAWQASRSLWVTVLLIVLALLLMSPAKLYGYPKMFLYPLAMWLCWRYIDRPSLARAIVLALGVAIAWGYRHDHGAYVGVGAAAAILAAHWPEGPRRVLVAWARFGVALLVLLAPYLILIQVNEGIPQYLRARLELAGRWEAGARQFVWFTADRDAPSPVLTIAPPPPARVQVDWKEEVTSDTRIALERTYSLTTGIDTKTLLLEYALSDVSEETLAALLVDPAVAQIKGVPATISIEWFASLTAEAREELERGYYLARPRRDPADGSGRALVYDLQDVSTANLRVLMADSFLVRTDGVHLPPVAATDGWPQAGDPVHIEWRQDLDNAARAVLERKYGLKETTPGRNRWEYVLTDVSPANIRRIVEDSHVADTGLIDRDTYRPMDEPWWVPLQRAVPLFRLGRPAPQWLHQANAGAWLYYVSFALPLVVLAALARDYLRGRTSPAMPHEGAKMFAAAVMMAVANVALLRRLGYFADHVDVAAVLGAWMIGRAVGPAAVRSAAGRLATAAAVAVLVVSVGATMAYAHPIRTFRATGLEDGVGGAWQKGVRLFGAYASSPPIDGYAPPASTGDRALLRYVYDCTRPGDRVWLLSDLLAFPYYTERRVVGHIYWASNFMGGLDYQRRIIDAVDKVEVPLVVSVGESRPLEFLESYDLLHPYVASRYTQHYTLPDEVSEGRVFRISTDSRRQPSGTYERLGLPCFK